MKKYYLILLAITFFSSPFGLSANEVEPHEVVEMGADIGDRVDSLMIHWDFPQILIKGSRQGVFGEIPGSVSRIDGRELSLLAPMSANEAVRSFTGVHIQEEEGAGLRVNLGLRGLDPNRSRNILMLEDGIPVALKPYGEPEMYYSPAIERMTGVEILKGSGQILYGPQTVGGVMNYITADPPEVMSGNVRLRAGSGGYFSGMGSVGNTYGNAGFNINYLFKRADRIGYVGFDVHDFNGKFTLKMGDNTSLAIKLGVYRETSNSTYIGLTQTMYDSGDQDHVRMAPDDKLDVSRESASVVHNWTPTGNLSISTTLFGNQTTRDWRRQDFSSDPDAPNQTGVVWGDPNVPGGAVFMQNSTGNRNRTFEVAGLEPRLTYDYGEHRLNAGFRILYERAFEKRINGSKADASSGVLRNDEVRTGMGYSAFAQNRFQVSDRMNITAGLRMESYHYERDILRGTFDGEIRDTSLANTSSVTSLIPGIGFNYNASDDLTFFGGLHRGFSPPRVKDAITSEGEAIDLDAELSWNSELGLRYRWGNWLNAEFTAFYMDFSNQIIPVAESQGAAAAGLINAGETRHLGFEVSLGFGIGDLLPSDYDLVLNLGLTAMESKFTSDRFFEIGEEMVNARGNTTPYAPQLLLHHEIRFETPIGLGARVSGHYTGEQYTDVINSEEPHPNGRTGQMDSHYQLDGNLYFDWNDKDILFNLSVKNITDSRYILSRRPTGIRVSTPRLFTFGIEKRF